MLIILIATAIFSYMLFFAVFIAPTVFKVLNEEYASKFLRAFFPKFYLFGIILSIIGFLISVNEKNNFSIIFFLLLISTFILSRQILMPSINKAKDNNKLKKFKKLHMISVFINLIQMAGCILIIIFFFN